MALNHLWNRDILYGAALLLVQDLEGKPSVYRGEISGWAETGANRVKFFLEDKHEVSDLLRNRGYASATSVSTFPPDDHSRAIAVLFEASARYRSCIWKTKQTGWCS